MRNKILLGIAFLLIAAGVYYYGTSLRTDKNAVEPVSLEGVNEVIIDMTNFSFVPKNVIITKGTKVTWVNKDRVGHSVKTDPHPEHSLFSEMNSGDMRLGDRHSFVFEKEGFYPYHCDPHVRGMIGTITVK